MIYVRVKVWASYTKRVCSTDRLSTIVIKHSICDRTLIMLRTLLNTIKSRLPIRCVCESIDLDLIQWTTQFIYIISNDVWQRLVRVSGNSEYWTTICDVQHSASIARVTYGTTLSCRITRVWHYTCILSRSGRELATQNLFVAHTYRRQFYSAFDIDCGMILVLTVVHTIKSRFPIRGVCEPITRSPIQWINNPYTLSIIQFGGKLCRWAIVSNNGMPFATFLTVLTLSARYMYLLCSVEVHECDTAHVFGVDRCRR